MVELADTVRGALVAENRALPPSPLILVRLLLLLLLPPAIANLVHKLLPLTTILTPNIPEALLLLRTAGLAAPPLTSVAAVKEVVRLLSTLGPAHVLVKGGHLPFTAELIPVSEASASASTSPSGNRSSSPSHSTFTAPTTAETETEPDDNTKQKKKYILDILYSARTHTHTIFRTDFLPGKNTHGTGCSLASAIAAGLVTQQREDAVDEAVESAATLGEDAVEKENATDKEKDAGMEKNGGVDKDDAGVAMAVEKAVKYVERAIKAAPGLGQGSGPIGHFHSLVVEEGEGGSSSLRRI